MQRAAHALALHAAVPLPCVLPLSLLGRLRKHISVCAEADVLVAAADMVVADLSIELFATVQFGPANRIDDVDESVVTTADRQRQRSRTRTSAAGHS